MSSKHQLTILLHLLVAGVTLLFPPPSPAQGETGEDPIVTFNRGQDLHEKGDLAGAIKLYQKAASLEPKFAEAHYQLGIAELALGHRSEAEGSFRKALEIRPEWSLASAKLGQLLVDRYIAAGSTDPGLYDEASSVLRRALEIDTNSFPALAALTDLLLFAPKTQPGRLKEMLASVTAATTGKTHVPAAVWASRAAIEERLGDRKAAAESLAKALAEEPNNPRALYQLASLATSNGDLVTAKAFISRFEVSGGDPDAVKFLTASVMAKEGELTAAAALLAQIGRPTAAAKDLSDRIKTIKSDDAFTLEKQLESDPNNSALLGRLCTLHRRSQPEKAIDYCRRAVEADPSNPDHAVGFGAALVQAKRYDDAVAFFRKLVAMVPANATAHANLATALFQLKRYDEAKIEYNWLIENQPGLAATYYFLGIVHDQLAEYLDAMANYQLYLKKADPVKDKDQIDNVNFRLPLLQKLIKEGKGKKT